MQFPKNIMRFSPSYLEKYSKSIFKVFKITVSVNCNVEIDWLFWNVEFHSIFFTPTTYWRGVCSSAWHRHPLQVRWREGVLACCAGRDGLCLRWGSLFGFQGQGGTQWCWVTCSASWELSSVWTLPELPVDLMSRFTESNLERADWS